MDLALVTLPVETATVLATCAEAWVMADISVSKRASYDATRRRLDGCRAFASGASRSVSIDTIDRYIDTIDISIRSIDIDRDISISIVIVIDTHFLHVARRRLAWGHHRMHMLVCAYSTNHIHIHTRARGEAPSSPDHAIGAIGAHARWKSRSGRTTTRRRRRVRSACEIALCVSYPIGAPHTRARGGVWCTDVFTHGSS